MLRITEERLGGSTVVHVAGRLLGPEVEELGRVCRATSTPLHIDLSGLLEADDVGLCLLRSLREAGADLTGMSPFMGLLLDPKTLDGAR